MLKNELGKLPHTIYNDYLKMKCVFNCDIKSLEITKKKLSKLDHKFKNFCASKDTIKK
jgi:hypothetical protein